MSLQLNIFPVKDIIFGKSTSYNNKVVSINKKELEDLVLSDNRIKDVDFEIVHPNDKTRITTVRDQIEPRIKISGPGCVYPGISGRSVETVGSGITNVLKGMSIFEVSDTVYYDGGDGEIETYIDMFEPGSLYTPYGSLHNLCVSINAKDDLHIEDKNDSIHGSILKISDLIASTTINQNPDEIKISDIDIQHPDLPNVAYIISMRSPEHYSASLSAHWTAIYGVTRLTPPWLINPNELFDGAISGMASWELVNNPVAWNLSQRHGKDINFVGCIAIRTRWSSQSEKFLTANQVASLCETLNVSGVVVSWDSGGNDAIEVIRTVQACENKNIKTVFLTVEETPDSGGPPLLEPLIEANAVVSTGFAGAAHGRYAKIPSPNHVIGRKTLTEVDPKINKLVTVDATGPLTRLPWLDRYGFTKDSAYEY